MKKMKHDATKAGLALLIKEMFKAESKAAARGECDKPEPMPEGIEIEVEVEPSSKAAPKITKDMKDMVKGFFQQKKDIKPPKEGKLYVGSMTKSPIEQPARKRRKRAKV